MAKMAELADAEQMAELEETTFAVYGHCAGGAMELWDIVGSRLKAVELAKKVLKDCPLSECGTGGVRWVEIFGPGIEESLGVERLAGGDVSVEGV